MTAASLLVRAARDASRAARSAARAARAAAGVAASSRAARTGSTGAASFGPHRTGLGGDAFLDRASPSSQTSLRGMDLCSDLVPPEQSLCTNFASEPDDLDDTTAYELELVAQEDALPCKVEFVAHEDDLASDEALWSLYERWCKAFNQERDADEMARRFNTFKATVLHVHSVNMRSVNDPDPSNKLEINKFADGKLKELMLPGLPEDGYLIGVPYSNTFVRMGGGGRIQKVVGHETEWWSKDFWPN